MSAIIGWLALAAAAAVDPQLSMLLANHAAARGGANAIESVRGVTLDLEIVEPGFTVEGRYSASRDGCMRIDVFAGGKHAISEGVSRHGAWEAQAGATRPTPQPPDGAAALRHGIEAPTRMIGLHEFAARGHRLSYVAIEDLDGRSYHRLAATYDDGYTADVFLDPRTHLIARMREHKAMHVAIDPTKQNIETRFSDYRSVDGRLFPFKSEEVDWVTGKLLGTTTVRRLAVNDAAAMAACAAPELPVADLPQPNSDATPSSGST